MPKEFFLDVSELEAPEPFERIIAIVRELTLGQYIKVLHRKEPFPLYDVLTENGFEYCVVQLNQPQFCIFIWLASDQGTANFCQQLARSLSTNH